MKSILFMSQCWSKTSQQLSLSVLVQDIDCLVSYTLIMTSHSDSHTFNLIWWVFFFASWGSTSLHPLPSHWFVSLHRFVRWLTMRTFANPTCLSSPQSFSLVSNKKNLTLGLCSELVWSTAEATVRMDTHKTPRGAQQRIWPLHEEQEENNRIWFIVCHLPLWCSLYPLVAYNLFKLKRKKKKIRSQRLFILSN